MAIHSVAVRSLVALSGKAECNVYSVIHCTDTSILGLTAERAITPSCSSRRASQHDDLGIHRPGCDANTHRSSVEKSLAGEVTRAYDFVSSYEGLVLI
jgi:hypothetical protein